MSEDIRDLIEFELGEDGSLRVVPRSEHVVRSPIEGVNRFGIIHLRLYSTHGMLVHEVSIAPSSSTFKFEIPPGYLIGRVELDRL